MIAGRCPKIKSVDRRHHSLLNDQQHPSKCVQGQATARRKHKFDLAQEQPLGHLLKTQSTRSRKSCMVRPTIIHRTTIFPRAVPYRTSTMTSKRFRPTNRASPPPVASPRASTIAARPLLLLLLASSSERASPTTCQARNYQPNTTQKRHERIIGIHTHILSRNHCHASSAARGGIPYCR